MDLNVAGDREAKGVAWETTAQTHMAVAFWVWGKQLVNSGMSMQKQTSALIASTVGRKQWDYGQRERRKSGVFGPSVWVCVCRWTAHSLCVSPVSAHPSLCCISRGSQSKQTGSQVQVRFQCDFQRKQRQNLLPLHLGTLHCEPQATRNDFVSTAYCEPKLYLACKPNNLAVPSRWYTVCAAKKKKYNKTQAGSSHSRSLIV